MSEPTTPEPTPPELSPLEDAHATLDGILAAFDVLLAMLPEHLDGALRRVPEHEGDRPRDWREWA